ncbi:MAG: phosphatase PAP2 family protein [Bacteroidetes bacterium]|nr:phosphatase PAP2 family protein [Bacteroidota bacterium]
MKAFTDILKNLRAVDFIVVVFCGVLSVINLIFNGSVPNWHLHIVINFFFASFAIFSSVMHERKNTLLWRQLHLWYLVPMIFIFFKELYNMIEPIRQTICDPALIQIDRFLFHTDPTVVLYKIANPYLTELLQIVYGTFFFLPVILGIDFMRQRKVHEFDYSAFIIVFGFFLSFIGYILVPAIGPRFTLHNFAATNSEMPGLFVTNFLREVVNAGESIPSGTSNPALLVQRDCFPSGHAQMTLLVMFLSVKFKSKLKWFFIVDGTLLIFATVYLRYHYVIDLIGGILFMIFTLWSGKYIYGWWRDIRKN